MAKSILLSRSLILLLSIVFIFVFMGLARPITTQASPGYGLTPTPTSLPPTATPVSPPTPTPQPTQTPKAPDDDEPDDEVTFQFSCNLTCSLDQPLAVNEAHVRLIHDGSGWIAEGTVSTGQIAHFQVPYPDQWQVYLITEEDPPHLLGTVNANSGTQFVDCPGDCPEPPPALPETGTKDPMRFLNMVIMVFWGLILVTGGLIVISIQGTFRPNGRRNKS
ncbi:MAG TPA: hypothetical protein VEC93_13315 [Anaerolineae bacterium]|nr:hypothetical protein [Anaerolineae bacterium]